MKLTTSSSARTPQTLEEYIGWAATTLNCDFGSGVSKQMYEINCISCSNTVRSHEFFRSLQLAIEAWDREYFETTSTHLLMGINVPEILSKPYTSAIDKSFRENVLLNKNYPEPPQKGWITADNMLSRFNDALRCSIVCKFIDGPAFTAEKLRSHASSLGLEFRQYSQARDEGYYAYHFYVSIPVKLVDRQWQEVRSSVEVEIQITTQLQEVLRSMTHNFYVENRLKPDKDLSKWKWEFSTNKFRVGYLSHTLHLLESIILDSREEMRRQTAQAPKQE